MTMNKRIGIAMALLFVGMFQHGFAQQESQPLIQPKMEMHDLFGMQPRNIRPGIVGRAVSLATLRLSRIEISKGTSTPDHNHADEEIVLLLQGSIRAYSGGKEFLLKPGEMITIPAYVQHHYVALTDSVTIEAFGPGGRNLSAPPQAKAP